MRISKLAAVCAASALLAGAAQGAPVQWNSGAGANGHWYDIVFSALTWGQAEAAAAGMTNLGQAGYLATVTSAEEQAFLNALNPNNTGAWPIGCQAPPRPWAPTMPGGGFSSCKASMKIRPMASRNGW